MNNFGEDIKEKGKFKKLKITSVKNGILQTDNSGNVKKSGITVSDADLTVNDLKVNNDLQVDGDIKSQVNFTGDIKINSGASLTYQTGSTGTIQTGTTITGNSGSVLVINGTLSIQSGVLSSSTTGDIVIGSRVRYSPTGYVVTSNSITEPNSKYVQIATNGADLKEITTTSTTNYAEITLITGASVSITVSDDTAGTGNIKLEDGIRWKLSGNKSLTLRKRDTTSYWVVANASHPKKLATYKMSYENLPDTNLKHLLGTTVSGYPTAVRVIGAGVLTKVIIHSDGQHGEGGMTGNISYEVWVDGTSEETFTKGDGDWEVISNPVGTSSLITTTYVHVLTLATPAELTSSSYIHVSMNISGTNMTTGPEITAYVHVLYD